MPSATFLRIPERSVVIGSIAATLSVAAILLWGTADGDSPAGPRPLRADTVVMELDNGSDPMLRLAATWRALQRQPGDADAATRYARLALTYYGTSGDARFLGYAEGALAPWREAMNLPRSVWLLRGRILQTQHRFADAGADLDRLLAAHGDSAEAMLLAADAWRRAGDIGRARSRCAGLAFAGWPDLARYCAADVLLSLGKTEEADQLLSSGVAVSADMPAEMGQWRLAVAADAAAAAGRVAEARSLFEQALASPGGGVALHVAYADLLLGEGRPQDAIDALSDLPDADADAVLLRRAIAAGRLGLDSFDQLRERLRARFADARAFDTARLHLREQALFELLVEDDPDAALALAEENWMLQKGWEDAALLIQAAAAADRPEAVRPVEDWRRTFDRHAT
jgi:tetratricopeptide (TPR) repeat protein